MTTQDGNPAQGPGVPAQMALQFEIAAWSDREYKNAARFTADYNELLGRSITRAQLAGLRNIVEGAPEPTDVFKYIRNQAQKADRQGRPYISEYWLAVEKALRGLESQAEAACLRAGYPLPAATRQHKAALAPVWLRFMREWVQHLVAESLMKMVISQE